MDLRSALTSRRLFFDGAMGTMLQAAGLPQGAPPDLWSLERPEVVEAVHRAYVEAGANLLKTNTFGCNRRKLIHYGADAPEVAASAVAAARRAAAAATQPCWVALDLGPTGCLLRPYGDLPFEEAVSLYAEVVAAGEKAGADCVLIETMSDLYELKAAVLAAKEHCRLPIFATVTLDGRGRLLTGGDLPAAVALLEGLGVSALGLNCGMGPDQMAPLLEELCAYSSIPLILNPNAGLPRSEGGHTVFDVGPQDFADRMAALAPRVRLLGGCCGTTPAHIAALVSAVEAIDPPVETFKDRLLLCSYARTVELGTAPVIIGERINPTGKKKLQAALRADDLDYVLREALAQQDAGAQLLDVNVGLPDLDEVALLPRVVEGVQSISPLPVQIDTSDVFAMEAALRLCNGKPLLNSVSGKRESLAAVLPLVKKYGGGLVCLTLDEGGIPADAQGRLEIARRIVETAEAYGIPRRELVVDVLTLPVSAGGDNAAVTLEALRRVKSELGVRTVLGVSNVSFGLPGREVLNTAFFTLAMEAGLDGAILNPMSAPMMGAWAAWCALRNRDPNCARYIDRMAATSFAAAAPPAAGGELDLTAAITKGLVEPAASLALSAARQPGSDVLAIIEASLIPALDQVGAGFEAGTVFLPQLLMCADAARAAFDVLRDFLPVDASDGGPTVILATVKGDIHDIGKNIVKVLLENYRFKVIDLGRDVDPDRIVSAALAGDVTLVGLSALMTTTAPQMAETIRRLKAAKPACAVVVGGAVITQSYADSIGADYYASDAMATVHYAQQHFGL